MAYAECVEAIRNAAGDLSEQEIDDIISELTERQRKLVASGQVNNWTEAALRAADEIAKENELAAVIAKRNAAINVAKRLEAVEFVRGHFADRPDLGVQALLVGTQRARPGSRSSAAAMQHALLGEYLGGLINDLTRSDIMPFFSSGVMDRDIARALWSLDNPDAAAFAGPKEAMEAAKIIRKWQDAARLKANKAGAWIGKVTGYITRQSHDQYKILKAGYDAWRATILPLLDMQRTMAEMPDADVEAFLKNVYSGLASGVHFKTRAVTGFKGPRNVAKKLSAERVLHFKDADSWFAYNQRFGTGSIRESVLRGLEHSARDTGLMQVLGTNPEANLNMVLDSIEHDLRDSPAKLRAFHTARNRITHQLREVDGTTRIAANPTGAMVASNVRAIENMAKLGACLMSQFSDLPIYASELNYQGRSFLSGLADGIAGLLKGRGSAEQKEVLSSLGVFFDSVRGNIVNRFSADDSLPGLMSKAQQMFFKLNGMSWWTDTMKASAALTMSHDLALNSRRGWDTLREGLRRTLSLYGIDRDRWALIRKSAQKQADGRAYLTPEGIADLPDEALSNYLEAHGRQSSPAAVDHLRDELTNQLRMYFVDRTSYAVLEPDAAVRATMQRGTQRGTIEGELLRFIGQFKSFSVVFVQRALGREIYGYGANSLREAMANGHGEMQGIAQLILWTTLFGYGSMSAKALLKGRTPRDPNDYRTWVAAMSQGGGLGIYGDFLFGEVKNRFGGGALSTAAGPALGTANDLFDLWGRMRDGDDFAAAGFKDVLNNTPFVNLFYTRVALDYLVLYRLQESMNPGYLRRMERRVEKENAQTFLIRPSQVVR